MWLDLTAVCKKLNLPYAETRATLETLYADGPYLTVAEDESECYIESELYTRLVRGGLPAEEPLYTVDEVAAALGVSTQMLRNHQRDAREAGVTFETPKTIALPGAGRPPFGYTKVYIQQMRDYLANLKVADDAIDPDAISEDAAAVLGLLKKGEQSIEDLADALDMAPKRTRAAIDELGRAGYKVALTEKQAALDRTIVQEPSYVSPNWTSNIIRLGVVSDVHIGNEQCKLNSVVAAYDYFGERGCELVVNAGDLFDGPPTMHRSKLFGDLKLKSLKEQIGYAREFYPRSIRTAFIGGNHDASWHTQAGINPVEFFCQGSDAWDYAGEICGFVKGPDGKNLVYLYHPSTGAPYGRSYASQRDAEWLSYSINYLRNDELAATSPLGVVTDDYPRLIIVGHYHKFNIHPGPFGSMCMLAPASCAATPFQIAKRLINDCGAMYLECTLGDDGKIVRLSHEVLWFPGGAELNYGAWQPQSGTPGAILWGE